MNASDRSDVRGEERPRPRRAAPPAPPPARPSRRTTLRRALASPDARRQAFVLREVLGPPVALRDDPIDRPV